MNQGEEGSNQKVSQIESPQRLSQNYSRMSQQSFSILDEKDQKLLAQIKNKSHQKSNQSKDIQRSNSLKNILRNKISEGKSTMRQSEENKFDELYKEAQIKSQTIHNWTSFEDDVSQNEELLNFEQLGRILYLMEILRIIIYDENNQIENFDQHSLNEYETKRRYNEMCFHEGIWALIAENEQSETISSYNTWCVLRIFLDPLIRSNSLIQFLIDFIKSTKNTRENITEEEIKNLAYIWNELNADKLFYKSTGFIRAKKMQEYQHSIQENMPFNPKIRDVNKIFDQKNLKSFIEKNGLDEQEILKNNFMYDSQQNSNQINSQQKPDSDQALASNSQSQINEKQKKISGSSFVVDSTHQNSVIENQLQRIKIMYLKQEVVQKKIQEQQIAKQSSEVQECFFQPQLTLNSSINQWAAEKFKHKNFVQRLYQYTPLEKKQEAEQIIEQSKQNEDLSHCSFYPKINKSYKKCTNSLLNGDDLVKGFDKQIQRLRKGNDQKLQLKQKLEHIPNGSRYEEFKELPPNPPKFLQRKPKTSNNIKITFDVQLSKEKSGRIIIYDGEDINQNVTEFANKYQLSDSQKQTLLNMVYEKLNIYEIK